MPLSRMVVFRCVYDTAAYDVRRAHSDHVFDYFIVVAEIIVLLGQSMFSSCFFPSRQCNITHRFALPHHTESQPYLPILSHPCVHP